MVKKHPALKMSAPKWFLTALQFRIAHIYNTSVTQYVQKLYRKGPRLKTWLEIYVIARGNPRDLKW